MNIPTIETSAFAIDLDEHQSQRLLERALRSRAEIILWPNTQIDERPLTGALAGHTRDGLLVHPGEAERQDRLPLVSEYCEASFCLDDSRLMFTTNVLDVKLSPEVCCLEIARPDRLQVVQRRRYHRRELRANTQVQIAAAGRGGRPAIEAALLNIATGGMACRVERAAADTFPIDAPVGLSFTLPEFAPFRLSGYLRGKTQAADLRHVILAVEFDLGVAQRDEIERLSDALYAPPPALVQG